MTSLNNDDYDDYDVFDVRISRHSFLVHFHWCIELTHSPYQPLHSASSAMSLHRSTTLPSIPRPGQSPYSNTHKQSLRCHQQWGVWAITHNRKTVYYVSTRIVQFHLLCDADYEADELPEWVISEVNGILCDEDSGALPQASCTLLLQAIEKEWWYDY